MHKDQKLFVVVVVIFLAVFSRGSVQQHRSPRRGENSRGVEDVYNYCFTIVEVQPSACFLVAGTLVRRSEKQLNSCTEFLIIIWVQCI